MFADLVFFNRELNASVIVELKRGKFRPNYLGQLSGYLTVYDMTDKKPHENPSIGIVLCQDANRQFVEIMVRDYDKPMGVATYRTAQEMPENFAQDSTGHRQITKSAVGKRFQIGNCQMIHLCPQDFG